jgi:hypothetical protein
MSTVTQMRTAVSTRTQTAVHLTDVITGAFSAIIATLGISRSYLDRNWDAIERGLMTWIDEGASKMCVSSSVTATIPRRFSRSRLSIALQA